MKDFPNLYWPYDFMSFRLYKKFFYPAGTIAEAWEIVWRDEKPEWSTMRFFEVQTLWKTLMGVNVTKSLEASPDEILPV